MRLASPILLLAAAGVAQAVSPTPAVAGQAPVPVLATLVLHFALTRSRPGALAIAVAAGVVQDSLGHVPMGYSSAAFAAVAALLYRYRDEVFESRALTHMMLGAVAAAAATLITGLLLTASQAQTVGAGALALKTFGAAALGVLAAPLVCGAARRFERHIGVEAEATR